MTSLQGQVRRWRLRGRTTSTAFGLAAVAFCGFLSLRLLPPHDSDVPLAPAQRRIQQQDPDYSSHKSYENSDPAGDATRLSYDRQKPEVSFSRLENAENITVRQIDVLRSNSLLEKTQLTALTALSNGMKLTASQERLMASMSPQKRKDLISRIAKTREQQEKTYLKQCRDRRQIVARPEGGEEIISTVSKMVRFPIALKKMKPEEWPPHLQIYQNLTHYPWSGSPSCRHLRTVFLRPHTRHPMALASFPSSGNTWIRYLIEGASGVFTGSMYDDTSLLRRGMYGEGVPFDAGMTLMQKTHGYCTGDAMKLSYEARMLENHIEQLNCQAVLIVRNPFRALISHRHLDVGGHTGYAPKAHFEGQGWYEFVTLKIRLWEDFYTDWLTRCDPKRVHVVHYENFKDDIVEEMKRILQFIGVPFSEESLKCMEKNSDGLFKRKPKNTAEARDPFTPRLKRLIYESLDHVNSILKEAAKEELPFSKYDIYDFSQAHIARLSRHVQN